ncbi:MAG: fluoride efflux transporter CrcB, partial [Rhodobacteraceae bacterium]|nr:fluoride efflux transporter CrcB [Paracoccaceae bacterium]
MSTAMVYLLVACGGGIGALLRFCLVQMVAFPYGTLSVNVV